MIGNFTTIGIVSIGMLSFGVGQAQAASFFECSPCKVVAAESGDQRIEEIQSGITGPHSASVFFQDGLRSGSATASADYGVLKVGTSASASSNLPDGEKPVTSGATAVIIDRLSVFSVIENFAFMNFYIAGSFSKSSMHSGFSLGVDIDYENGDYARYQFGSGGGKVSEFVDYANFSNNVFSDGLIYFRNESAVLLGDKYIRRVSVPVNLNSPFKLTSFSSCVSRAFPGSGSVCNSLQSVYWGGFSLSDIDGNPIADFSLVSDSGVDWRGSFIPTDFQPPAVVPEPGIWGMLISGFVVTGVVARRARRSKRLSLHV
jgi:hypothetical protein